MSYTSMLMAFVKDRPYLWISATELEQFGRLCWRTEISRARKKFEAVNDGTIENRLVRDEHGRVLRSEYRYIQQVSVDVARDSDQFNANAPRDGRLV